MVNTVVSAIRVKVILLEKNNYRSFRGNAQPVGNKIADDNMSLSETCNELDFAQGAINMASHGGNSCCVLSAVFHMLKDITPRRYSLVLLCCAQRIETHHF